MGSILESIKIHRKALIASLLGIQCTWSKLGVQMLLLTAALGSGFNAEGKSCTLLLVKNLQDEWQLEVMSVTLW